MDCTICVVKIKALISWAVTVQLICAFVFVYAKSVFPHDAAQITSIHVNANSNSLYSINLFELYSMSYSFGSGHST